MKLQVAIRLAPRITWFNVPYTICVQGEKYLTKAEAIMRFQDFQTIQDSKRVIVQTRLIIGQSKKELQESAAILREARVVINKTRTLLNG